MEMMDEMLKKAEKEKGFLSEEQPLYVDEDDLKIKCTWCGIRFNGSQQLKHVNQHVRKSSYHAKERIRHLRKGGAQRDVREFMSFDIPS